MKDLVQIGQCYSGLLLPGYNPYSRIALATPQALRRIRTNTALQKNIGTSARPGKCYKDIFAERSMGHNIFCSNQGTGGIGVYCTDGDHREVADYRAAIKKLMSMEEGSHRRIILMIMGITISPIVEKLPPNRYSALLSKIKTECQGLKAHFNRVVIKRGAKPDYTNIHNNRLRFSLESLASAEKWATIEDLSMPFVQVC